MPFIKVIAATIVRNLGDGEENRVLANKPAAEGWKNEKIYLPFKRKYKRQALPKGFELSREKRKRTRAMKITTMKKPTVDQQETSVTETTPLGSSRQERCLYLRLNASRYVNFVNANGNTRGTAIRLGKYIKIY
ncbi:hypothetical protein KM043_009121 [Ampulex compressa]|nr:hypothetical protein KM043_009121 [Ampulex compressa]